MGRVGKRGGNDVNGATSSSFGECGCPVRRHEAWEGRKKRPRDSSSPMVYGQKVVKRPAGATSASGGGRGEGQAPGGAAGFALLTGLTF